MASLVISKWIHGDPANPANGLYQWDGWGMPASETYKYMGGTSMSNPLVAGGATVVRDYFFKAHDGHNASAALVKATLINSADDMLDENNDGADDNSQDDPYSVTVSGGNTDTTADFGYYVEPADVGDAQLGEPGAARLQVARAIELAQADWRDVLMASRFGEDVEAHNRWNP